MNQNLDVNINVNFIVKNSNAQNQFFSPRINVVTQNVTPIISK